MPYSADEARTELLDSLGGTIGRIELALEDLGEAYELLDEASGERLEQTLFRPVRAALGQARRTHAEFAERHRVAAPAPPTPSRGPRPHDGREAVERAVREVLAADETLGALGDSDYALEVGDGPLREGIAEVRRSLGSVPAAARALERTRGR